MQDDVPLRHMTRSWLKFKGFPFLNGNVKVGVGNNAAAQVANFKSYFRALSSLVSNTRHQS